MFVLGSEISCMLGNTMVLTTSADRTQSFKNNLTEKRT